MRKKVLCIIVFFFSLYFDNLKTMAIFFKLSKVIILCIISVPYLFSILKKKKRNVWDKIIYILDFLQQTFILIFLHDGKIKIISQVWKFSPFISNSKLFPWNLFSTPLDKKFHSNSEFHRWIFIPFHVARFCKIQLCRSRWREIMQGRQASDKIQESNIARNDKIKKKEKKEKGKES